MVPRRGGPLDISSSAAIRTLSERERVDDAIEGVGEECPVAAPAVLVGVRGFGGEGGVAGDGLVGNTTCDDGLVDCCWAAADVGKGVLLIPPAGGG